jgi:hypothetical protein
MASEISPNEEPLGSLAQSDSSEQSLVPFALFPQLPAEIRIQVWESSFVPRRIILKRHSSRPPLGLRSSCALLLVNNEAYRVFIQNYALCFRYLGLKGIYINYLLDALVFGQGLHGLKKMLQQYPRVMQRIQWLDIPPNGHSRTFDWGGWGLEPMSSLKLVTVRLNSDPRDYDTWTRSHMANIDDIQPTIQHLSNAIQFTRGLVLPKIAVLFTHHPPREDIRICNKLRRYFDLKDPSASTWDRFEVGLLELWEAGWSLRGYASNNSWIAYEVEKKT